MKPFWSDRIDYLRRFLARDGLWMMASQGTVKVLGFVAVVLVTRTASETEYGWYAYAMGLVATAVPFMGFGAYQAFVRFSVLTAHAEERVELHRRATGWGLTGALGLASLLTLAASRICADVPESAAVMRLLAWVTVSTFWMEHVKGLARALNDNKTSAHVDLAFAALLVLGAGVGVHLGGIHGYALAVVLSPFLAALPFGMKLGALRMSWGRLSELAPGFWPYGVHTALGAVLAKGFYAVDVFLIGRLWLEDAEALAVYRVAWLIHLATHVLPTAVAAPDCVRNASNHDQGQEIWSYLVGYWRTFGWISAVALGAVAWAAPWLLEVFGPRYADGVGLMRLLLVGSLGAHVLRIPLGNLLSALGRANWNTWANIAVLLVTAMGCMWRIPELGLMGAAEVMAAMMWGSGLLSLGLVAFHVRQLPH